MSLFDNALEIITRKLKYTEEISIIEMEKHWIEYLGIEIESFSNGEYKAIIVPPINILIDNLQKLKPDQYVYTDCRFFALLIGVLKKSKPNDKGMFFMHTSINSGIEIQIPPSNLYISLDRDFFVDYSEEKPIVFTDALLGSKGQWIVNIYDDKYMGIVTDGPILLTLEEWRLKYQEIVTKELETDRSKEISGGSILSTIRMILQCKIKKFGIKVSFYKFTSMGDCIDIGKNKSPSKYEYIKEVN